MLALALVAACQAGPPAPAGPAAGAGAPAPATAAPRTPTVTRSARPAPSPARRVVVVRYRLERHVTDAATATFAAVVQATLTDPRGWVRAGFRLVRDDTAPYVVLLGEPAEVQRRCEPYDVFRTYSCQNGPVVALNAERWRHATPKWTGTLAAYRQMLVDHEVGHLLGMHHPTGPQCPRAGRPERVMAQQSTELNGCLPNPWPLAVEISRAARHDLPLAPPAEP